MIKEEVNRSELVQKLASFMQFERDLRSAQTLEAFGFVACNSVRKLLQFDSALLLVKDSIDGSGIYRVTNVSGVSLFDAEAPLVKLSQQLVNSEQTNIQDTELHTVDSLPVKLGKHLSQMQLKELVTVVIVPARVTLVFIRNAAWRAKELQLLQQISEPAGHAVKPLLMAKTQKRFSIKRMRLSRLWLLSLISAVLLVFLPVRQSVIATGEISARTPTVITSGLNGVIGDVLVSPNENVVRGQTLLVYDKTELSLQKSTLNEELGLAQERLRIARQRNLLGNGENQNNRYSDLQTQVDLKAIELAYIDKMMQRLEIKAESNGIALFSRAQDWVGRSVMTGEKIMEIADSADQQFEIWVATGDAIDLPVGAQVKFFPDAFPMRSLHGTVESTSFYATQTKPDAMAYRVLANLDTLDDRIRLGMKGTFRLYGESVSLGYYLFRKPLSSIRRGLGV